MQEYEIFLSTEVTLTKLVEIIPNIEEVFPWEGRFYFFYEGDVNLIRTTSYNKANWLAKKLFLTSVERELPNHDTEGFGDHWPKVIKLFEANTSLAISLIKNEKREPLLHTGKIIHCLMNTLGYEREDEIDSYEEWRNRHHDILSKGSTNKKAILRGSLKI